MIGTTASLPRFVALACAVLSMCVIAPANAQDIDVKVLELRVQELETRVNVLTVETVQDRALLADDLSKIKRDLAQLKQEMVKTKTDIAQLQGDVAQLKNRPADPGKPPKPADDQSLTLRAPFTVKDAAGRIIFLVDVPADRNLPRAIVGNPAGAHVEMGPGPGGSAALGLFDDSKKLLVALTGNPQASYLRLRDNEQTANLGKIEGIGQGLFLRKGEKDVAELSTDKAGAGTLRIFGASGKAVAGLFSDTDGARLALTSAAGGKTALSLAVTQTGGKIRVFSAEGGKARAELIADDAIGAMSIFGSDGSTAATLASAASNAGSLEISNGRGSIVVQAGADKKSGRGMVSTGPYDAGVAASMINVGKPASSLIGSNAAK